MCGIGRVGCQYGPPSRASPTTPPGVNIDDACTEKGMCSVAYSSTTHRPYTDEHTTQLYQISYPIGGPNGLRRPPTHPARTHPPSLPAIDQSRIKGLPVQNKL